MVTANIVRVIGGGLAGTEAAWQLARRGVGVELFEMRPQRMTAAHSGGNLGELAKSSWCGVGVIVGPRVTAVHGAVLLLPVGRGLRPRLRCEANRRRSTRDIVLPAVAGRIKRTADFGADEQPWPAYITGSTVRRQSSGKDYFGTAVEARRPWRWAWSAASARLATPSLR